jgi:hypothetical protein
MNLLGSFFQLQPFHTYRTFLTATAWYQLLTPYPQDTKPHFQSMHYALNTHVYVPHLAVICLVVLGYSPHIHNSPLALQIVSSPCKLQHGGENWRRCNVAYY